MASFKTKMDWRMLRKRKIKIIVSFRPYSTHNRKFQKNSKKIKKIKKYHDGFILSQNRLDNAEKERK